MRYAICVFALLAACSFGPGNIQTRHSTDLEQRKIKRIAVLPPESSVTETKNASAATVPALETRAPDAEAAEIVARVAYREMAPMRYWQIVSESEVKEVGQAVGRLSEASRLRRVGEMVHADAVLTARVLRYRERVGEEWGAKSPASVGFVLELWDVKRGDMVWFARFDETQKSLSENIFALGDISKRGIKWLTAEQLAAEGVKKAVSQLHQTLFRNAA